MSETTKLLVTMTCPYCGGQVLCEEGESLAICTYCDSVFSLDAEEGAAQVMYKLAVTKDKAEKTVRGWMANGRKAENLIKDAEIAEIYPIYLPFWRLIARGKACVCGYDEDKDKDGHTRKTPREALINREYVYNDIACNPGDLGINSIRIPNNAQAVSFDDGEIATFTATLSKDDSYRSGCEAIIAEAIHDGKQSIDKITFSKGFCFPKGFTKVYYPFWIVRYTYQDRSYFATVDGITEEIVSGRAPGNVKRQGLYAGGGGTIAGAMAGIGIGFVSMGEETAGFAIPLLFVAAILIWYSYQQFRYGDEVLQGSLKGSGIQEGAKIGKVDTVVTGTHDYFS